jgi:hypothetical protein
MSRYIAFYTNIYRAVYNDQNGLNAYDKERDLVTEKYSDRDPIKNS